MPRVLVTKLLSKAQQNLLLNQAWSYVEYAAIQKELVVSKDFFSSFTSKNLIVTSPFVAEQLTKYRPKVERIFVVGEKTSEKLRPFYTIQEIANYGKELAEKIITDYAEEGFDFLCGNLRKDNIPEELNKHGVQLSEQQVYETKFNQKVFTSRFDAIIFASPSAVKSFFSCNSIDTKTTCICIGKTTALEASKFSKNLLIASKPSMENCIVKLKSI